MSFPINSTSVMTATCERNCRVIQRTKAAKHIAYGGVFSCRKIANSISWSQHSWGNAVDLFPKSGNSVGDAKDREIIANAVVYNTLHRTKANRGKKLPVAEVIDHDGRRIWTKSGGWAHYSGATGNHVHVSADPLKTGTPPCA